ncbi:MAG: site-2 protease family protein [Solirubrobacteraceae bacterium]|nr:site-2 protease family protein [Solirubrobacteraceae bacterium]
MGGGSSIQLVRLFGIRIGASFSWFFVLFLLIWLLSSYFADISGDTTTGFLLAVSAAVLFFVSLTLHELGHALVARREGIDVVGIDLWFFGGVAKMSRDTNSPGEEFRVAGAGPAVTLIITLVCVVLLAILDSPSAAGEALTFGADPGASSGEALVGYLGAVNAFLLIFNLIPAFPLDGGRLARALVWKVTGDRNKATRAAGYTGQGLAYLMIGLGLAMAFVYNDPFGGIWLAVLGWFLASAARSAVVGTAFTERLDGITVEDIMDREPVTIPADVPALRAQDEWFLRYRWAWFPVTDAAGTFLGLLRSERVDGAVAAGQPMLAAGELLDEDAATWRVRADEPLESLLGNPELRQLGALMAVDPDGRLRGVVTIQQVQRALTAALPNRAA